jgi:hypothetical protein
MLQSKPKLISYYLEVSISRPCDLFRKCRGWFVAGLAKKTKTSSFSSTSHILEVLKDGQEGGTRVTPSAAPALLTGPKPVSFTLHHACDTVIFC